MRRLGWQQIEQLVRLTLNNISGLFSTLASPKYNCPAFGLLTQPLMDHQAQENRLKEVQVGNLIPFLLRLLLFFFKLFSLKPYNFFVQNNFGRQNDTISFYTWGDR